MKISEKERLLNKSNCSDRNIKDDLLEMDFRMYIHVNNLVSEMNNKTTVLTETPKKKTTTNKQINK